MTPSQRQLIKEAFSEGYEQALIEQRPPRGPRPSRTLYNLRRALLRRAERLRVLGKTDSAARITRGIDDSINNPTENLDRIYTYILSRMRLGDIMAPGMSKRLSENLSNLYEQLIQQIRAGTMTVEEAINVMEDYYGQYLRDLDTPGEDPGFPNYGGPGKPPRPPIDGIQEHQLIRNKRVLKGK